MREELTQVGENANVKSTAKQQQHRCTHECTIGVDLSCQPRQSPNGHESQQTQLGMETHHKINTASR